MENQSYVKDHDDSGDNEEDGEDDKELMTEEERQRRIQKYKEMIQSLESPSRGILSPSSSKAPLNGTGDSSPDHMAADPLPEKSGLDFDGNSVLLLNLFLVNKKRHRVFLSNGVLIWEREKGDQNSLLQDGKSSGGGGGGKGGNSKSRTTISVDDLIAIKVPQPKNKHKSTTDLIEEDNNTRANSFTLHFARRRKCDPNKWKHSMTTFYNSDFRIVASWVRNIQQILQNNKNRPRRLLVFVNPYGGKRKAMQIYDRHAKPLFELAGIDVNVVVTQRALQMQDIVLSTLLANYDGIVCVGGDGSFNELYNGLVKREMNDRGYKLKPGPTLELPRPKMPIGVIPGGSTNTIAYCLNGTDDIETSIIHVILGQIGGMDLSSIHRNSGDFDMLKLYASVVSYGYLGDVTSEAENYRNLGPSRYDYVGVQKFLKNRGYQCHLKVLVPPNDDHEVEERKCLEGCEKCRMAKEELEESFKELQREINVQENWKVITGKYFMISGANLSCACVRSPQGMSPYCHSGDGYVDLMLVKHTSLFNNIRLLLKLSGKSGSMADLPFVEMYRTKAFMFCVPNKNAQTNEENPNVSAEMPSVNASTEPIDSKPPNGDQTTKVSCWNCDGEIIEETDVMVRTHCQLVNVYRSGIRSTKPKASCCGMC